MSNTGSDRIDSSIDKTVDEAGKTTINTSTEEVSNDASVHSAINEPIDRRHDFGTILSQARIEQDYSIAEINEQIKVPYHVLLAIEASDLAALPAPTFTQGYIHSYAKFLEISEESVLALYRRALPGNSLSSLKPRSTLSKKSGNKFPAVKIATIALILISVSVLIYNSLQSDIADPVDSRLDAVTDGFSADVVDTGNAEKIAIKQQARLSKDGELLLDKKDLNSQRPEANANNIAVDTAITTVISTDTEAVAGPRNDSVIAGTNATDSADEIAVMEVETQVETANAGTADDDRSTVASTVPAIAVESAENITPTEQQEIDLSEIVPDTEMIDPGDDTISFFAELEAWVDVRDANDTQLYYNMLPEGGSRTFTGLAPFSVTIGNARTIIVEVNNIEVDLSRRIRSTNTATFTVSTDEKRVIFH